MLDNTIPGAVRLSMYLASRYLRELQVALQLVGVSVSYERPGFGGIGLPRLRLPHGEADKAIYAIPRLPCGQRMEGDTSDPQWWFVWSPAERLRPICPAVDMNQAARIIAEQVNEDA